ncbi:error-prone DNA polymerase [Aurantivibrio plasticivorans]
MSQFAELHCLSNFTFLRSASHPEELVWRAAELGYRALAITDECSLAGVVKAHSAAKAVSQSGLPLQLIIGTELHLHSNPSNEANSQAPDIHLLLLCPNRTAYSEVSGLISRARRRSDKGHYYLALSDLQFGTQHCLAIWLPKAGLAPTSIQILGQTLASFFKHRLWIGVTLNAQGDDQAHYHSCQQLADICEIPMVACNNAQMHHLSRKPLHDVLTAIRLNTPVQDLGTQRLANAENYLRPIEELQQIYPAALLEESVHIANHCHFSLDELRYEYPEELVPKGQDATVYLRKLTFSGAQQRWPQGIPPSVREQLDKELATIAELRYEHYFLTVYDLVRFARSQHILCQGRGSAANSAVCYCLFITEVDPAQSDLLFERFISKERNEPPDIDVDFEHEQREEVIQYIYRKYTRKRAALAATVITYRSRSAIRDVGKALGFDDPLIDKLAKSMAWWNKADQLAEHFRSANLLPSQEPSNNNKHRAKKAGHYQHIAQQFLSLVKDIIGFPRHLSQHVGGFLITHSPISTLVPIENAAMPDRTIVQWDKTDIEALGLLKIDVLALGMLTAIRKSIELINQYSENTLSIANIPKEDPKTYNMLCRGDSIGVFQVESRAQMAMLPRLKPKTFYDLVIQVAIVRPGPIQGDMVHPYLKRRNGEEAVTYPNDDVKAVLERTLGVPIFQEQVIKLAMVAAGFSGGEADQLRRAMASWGKNGHLQQFHDKVINGMLSRGHDREFAERLFRQMQGFGEYGFPESHAASFALLVYISAWLKCHYPAAFYCGLLNSLPMGFYSPSQLIQDAQRHQIKILPVDVRHSQWDHCLYHHSKNPVLEQQPAIRLGMRIIKGFNRAAAERIVSARKQAFTSGHDIRLRAQLNQQELSSLVNADALLNVTGHRHQTHWDTQSIASPTPLLGLSELENTNSHYTPRQMAPPDKVATTVMDYHSTGLTLNSHPMALLREQHTFSRCRRAQDLYTLNTGRFVRIAGLVTGRQRPGTASGVIFMTLEDETGNSNIVIWRDVLQRFRQQILTGRLLLIKGVVERKDSVIHVIAGDIIDYSEALPTLRNRSRDFH